MGFLTLLPPVLAISLALWNGRIIPALCVGILAAELLLHNLNPVGAALSGMMRAVEVASTRSNAEVLAFSLLVGGLLELLRASGGVLALVRYLLKSGIARGQKSAGVLTALLGILIFIESNLSILTTGIFARGLFDRFSMSRARLAFIIDSTCAPVSILILLNGWGAYVLALLGDFKLENAVETLVGSIPLNFYALIIVAMALYTAWSSRVHFSLAQYEAETGSPANEVEETSGGRKRYFLLPLFTLVASMVGFMYRSGNGVLRQGSGSASILYATITSILLLCFLLRWDKVMSGGDLLRRCLAGIAELIPIVSIVFLALILGNAMQSMGTGAFVASLIPESLPLALLPPLIFLAAAAISFTTGTSWGTFALLIPIAIPVALDSGLSPSLVLAAVLGGGVFGDHCSPISDSTILSSLAAGCTHMEHVKTQLPYAILAAAASLLLFFFAGVFAQ